MGAKNLADFPVEPGGIVGRGVDHLQPLQVFVAEFRLRQEIRGLHYGFYGITEVVRQGAQRGYGILRHLCRVAFHGGRRTFSPSNECRPEVAFDPRALAIRPDPRPAPEVASQTLAQTKSTASGALLLPRHQY